MAIDLNNRPNATNEQAIGFGNLAVEREGASAPHAAAGADAHARHVLGRLRQPQVGI